jgi:predicted ATP-grasp superfamily ATP-dependent carboligase
MSEAPEVLIAAASGRALAASARRAGYAPLVVDFFADDDPRAVAKACVRLEGGAQRGFQADALLAACEQIAGSAQLAGFVYGSGFEDRPAILDAVERRWRLLGNRAEVVLRLKDPLAFAALCRDCAAPHPQTSLERPDDLPRWLARQRGGSGGGHIRAAHDDPAADAQTYYQKRVAGRPVSALILADGARCSIVGFSDQWASPTLGRPFRYGGAVRPAALAPTMAQSLTSAVRRLVSRAPLVGLNSMDFVVSDDQFWLLEVNPRPGATLDIFESENTLDDALFAQHVAACNGELLPPLREGGARAAAIVRADCDVISSPRMEWPIWAKDRQPAGSFVGKGEPFCTVLAEGANAAEAMRLLNERSASVRLSIRMRAA